LRVDLGPMPPDEQCGGSVENGLRAFLKGNELCDIALVVGDQSFCAHSLVLAASSPTFREVISEQAKCARGFVAGIDRAPTEIHLSAVTHPEAVRDMLDCIYGSPKTTNEIASKTEGAYRDCILLAQSFKIPQLQVEVSRQLTQCLTTQNVLARLAICEEFQLADVYEKILEQLISDPVVLPLLARDPAITKAPKVLQDLLLRILALTGVGVANSSQQGTTTGRMHGKHSRKAGA